MEENSGPRRGDLELGGFVLKDLVIISCGFDRVGCVELYKISANKLSICMAAVS
jgi:hypothetical protein